MHLLLRRVTENVNKYDITLSEAQGQIESHVVVDMDLSTGLAITISIFLV